MRCAARGRRHRDRQGCSRRLGVARERRAAARRGEPSPDARDRLHRRCGPQGLRRHAARRSQTSHQRDARFIYVGRLVVKRFQNTCFELLVASLLIATTACAVAGDDTDDGFDDSTDEVSTVVADDDLNGLWTATIDGAPATDDVVIESWSAVGIRVHVGADVYQLSRNGDTLSSGQGSLDRRRRTAAASPTTTMEARSAASRSCSRATSRPSRRSRSSFPGDRPFRSFLTDTARARCAAGSRVVQALTTTTDVGHVPPELRALQARLVAAEVHEGRHLRASRARPSTRSSTRSNGLKTTPRG